MKPYDMYKLVTNVCSHLSPGVCARQIWLILIKLGFHWPKQKIIGVPSVPGNHHDGAHFVTHANNIRVQVERLGHEIFEILMHLFLRFFSVQTASGTVEAKVTCFYRRRDLSSALIALADKHHSEWPFDLCIMNFFEPCGPTGATLIFYFSSS